MAWGNLIASFCRREKGHAKLFFLGAIIKTDKFKNWQGQLLPALGFYRRLNFELVLINL